MFPGSRLYSLNVNDEEKVCMGGENTALWPPDGADNHNKYFFLLLSAPLSAENNRKK